MYSLDGTAQLTLLNSVLKELALTVLRLDAALQLYHVSAAQKNGLIYCRRMIYEASTPKRG